MVHLSRQPVTEAEAEAIYDILVEHAGAQSDPDERWSFVHAVVKGTTEYRFIGNLGFGGKFWPDHWTVTCYIEHETPERTEIIRRTNKALADLLERMRP